MTSPGHADIAPSRHYGGHGAISVVCALDGVCVVSRAKWIEYSVGIQVDVVDAACWHSGGYRIFI